MSQPAPLFVSSGDLIADRRYQHGKDFEARGDLDAAADMLVQTLERTPGFAAAWFALGEVRERLGDREGAMAAFECARAAEPADAHGAGLRLARLGKSEPGVAMTPAYVRALFDQYAPRFEGELTRRLSYRGPALLRDVAAQTCAAQDRPFRFARTVDLGCGTGLTGEAFAGSFDAIAGVDLSPAMIEQARRKGIYTELFAGDMQAFLDSEVGASVELVLAADVLVYGGDLYPICAAVARVLRPDGLFAFTVETHAGDGVVLGEKLRYAHGEPYVRAALATAGLAVVDLRPAWARTENGVPVPGLVVMAAPA
jgi:predicted TPR repeat methyltransferase